MDIDDLLIDLDESRGDILEPDDQYVSGDQPSAGLIISALALCGVSIGSLAFDWISGQGISEYGGQGVHLVGAAAIVLGSAAVSILLLVVATVRRDHETIHLICVPAGVLVAFCAVLIVSIESVTAFMPLSHLPKTFSRVGVGASAGVGVWVSLIAGAALLVLGVSVGNAELRDRLLGLVSDGKIIVIAAAIGFAGLALARLRYSPLVSVDSGDEVIPIALWWFPVIGPISLAATWALVASSILVLVGRSSLAAVLGVIAGWVTASLAVWAYAARTVAVRFDELTLVLPRSLREELETNSYVGAYADRLQVSVTLDAHATELLILVAALVASAASLLLFAQLRNN